MDTGAWQSIINGVAKTQTQLSHKHLKSCCYSEWLQDGSISSCPNFFFFGNFIFIVVQLLSCVYSLQPHGLQHTRLPCPSLNPRVCTNSCPLSWWCHPTILPPSLPPSIFPSFRVFFNESALQIWCQSIGASASASVLPMNIQGWFPLGLTGLISLLSSSVQFSHSDMSDSLQRCGLQHARLFCPPPTPRACSNSCPWSLQCHPTILSSVIPFSSWRGKVKILLPSASVTHLAPCKVWIT